MESRKQTRSKKLRSIDKAFENQDILITISEFLADHELLSFLLVSKSVSKIRKQSKIIEIRLLKYNLQNAQKILKEYGNKSEPIQKKKQRKNEYNPSFTYPSVWYPWSHSFYLKVNLSIEKLLLQPFQAITTTAEESPLSDEEANQIYNFYLDNLTRRSIHERLPVPFKAMYSKFQIKETSEEKKKEHQAILSFLKTAKPPTEKLSLQKKNLQENNQDLTKEINELLYFRKSPKYADFEKSQPAVRQFYQANY